MSLRYWLSDAYMASQPSCSTTERLIILELMGSPHGRARGRGQREEAGQVPGAGGRVQDGSGLESSLLGLRRWASEDFGAHAAGRNRCGEDEDDQIGD